MNDFYNVENVEDFGHYPERGRPAYATYVIKDGKGRQAVGPCFGFDEVRKYLADGGVIHRCEPYRVWAEGALRFLPGWDSTKKPRVLPDELSNDTGIFNKGCSTVHPTTIGEEDNR